MSTSGPCMYAHTDACISAHTCTLEHGKTCTHTQMLRRLSISWLDEHHGTAYLSIVTAARMQNAKGELPSLFCVRPPSSLCESQHVFWWVLIGLLSLHRHPLLPPPQPPRLPVDLALIFTPLYALKRHILFLTLGSPAVTHHLADSTCSVNIHWAS